MSEDMDIEDQADHFFGIYLRGCCDPDEALTSFKEIMSIFEPREDAIAVNLEKWNEYEAKHGAGILNLFMYFLDGFNITEHGSSIIGAWLTPLGKLVRRRVLEVESIDDLKF